MLPWGAGLAMQHYVSRDRIGKPRRRFTEAGDSVAGSAVPESCSWSAHFSAAWTGGVFSGFGWSFQPGG